MKPELAIRPMTPGDITTAMALTESLPSAPRWPRSTYEFALDPSSKPERIALVAEGADSSLAGFAIASIAGGEAELESIAVASRFQHQGVARALFANLATRLAGRGVSEVFLEVRASNLSARGLYAGLGFTETGLRKAYYADPAEDAVVLRLDLP